MEVTEQPYTSAEKGGDPTVISGGSSYKSILNMSDASRSSKVVGLNPNMKPST